VARRPLTLPGEGLRLQPAACPAIVRGFTSCVQLSQATHARMEPIPPLVSATRRIKRIAPLQLAKMSALVYGVMGLLFCPVFLVMSLMTSHLAQQQRVGMMVFGTGFALMMPVIYAVMGFVFGALSAFIYNVAARWIGGIEVEVE